MIYRQQKLTAIYKEIANKELTLGCKIIIDGEIATIVDGDKYWEWLSILREDWWTTTNETSYEFTEIWHPVMIGDVISYLRKPFEKFVEWQPVGENWLVDSYSKNINNLLVKWFDTSTSIEEQDDECIDFVYSLIKK